MVRAIKEGEQQHNRKTRSLLLSSIAAGLILGFSGMAVAVVASAINGGVNPLFERLAMALVYPLGFVICILSGTQLFTEHTATAVYPVLDKRSSLASLVRVWLVVIFENLFGALISSVMMFQAKTVINASIGYVEIGHHLTQFDFGPLLISAILAGWLMAQGSWMLLATPSQTSQILCIYIVTFLIGVGGLHHSIAGAAEIFTAAMISNLFTIREVFFFVGTALLGNLIGGSVFVATLNYGHIRQTQLDD